MKAVAGHLWPTAGCPPNKIFPIIDMACTISSTHPLLLQKDSFSAGPSDKGIANEEYT